jgi:ethanolamine permease
MEPDPKLEASLGTLHLWGLAVGLVISGEYFGWSYGWQSAGTLGFLVTTAIVALFYLTFVLALTELTSALPSAGGAYLYAERALGRRLGFVAGFASVIELTFAPPAIALSIGAYLAVQFPGLSPTWAALGCYAVFMGLNIWGVRVAATFELFVTCLAVLELLVFMGVMAPAFSFSAFAQAGFSGEASFSLAALPGIVKAAPFAIWFFLGIEGAALVVEEVKDPVFAVPRAFVYGIVTLLVLALGVMFAAGGTGGTLELAGRNDPLPAAMSRVVGASSGFLHMLVWIGLFGLVASFHGIILGYSRQIFALSRAGYLPRALSALHARRRTPHRAILVGGLVGALAIVGDQFFLSSSEPLTTRLVTLSVLGALTLYVLALVSLFALRKKEPNLTRPFRVPGFPFLPALSLLLGLVLLAVVVFAQPALGGGFFAVLGLGAIFLREPRVRVE